MSNEDTDSYYDQHIAPLANEFESKRLEAVRIFRARIRLVSPIVGAAAIVWIVLTINLFGEDALFYCAGGLAFLALAAYGYFKRPLDAYRDEMRQDIYPLIVRSFGESFTYQRSCPWRVETLEASMLLPRYDKEELEDYIVGIHNDVTVEMVQAELIKRVRSSKKNREKTVFKGLLFVMTSKKPFNGKIVVKRDGGIIGNTIGGIVTKTTSELQTVRLEDIEFEDKYEVYATDQIEARTVLTTSFMQRLLDLGHVVGNDKIDCSFFDNRLLIRAPTSHDYFAPQSVFKSVDFRKEFDTVTMEMKIIFDVIDTLKLDLEIGL